MHFPLFIIFKNTAQIINMKHLFLVFLLTILSINSFAQRKKVEIKTDEIIIPLNKEIKINAEEKNGKFSNFKLISETKIEEPIDMMETLKKIEKKEIVSNEIDFKFSEANLMGSKLIILTTVQHFTKPIIFKAQIKIKGNNDYVETSIVPKGPNVFSVEQWRDEIESIILSNFKFDEK